jgi:putative transposase
MDAATTLAPIVGIVSSCQALGLARASFDRQTRPSPGDDEPLAVTTPVRVSPRALDAEERQAVLDVLHS